MSYRVWARHSAAAVSTTAVAAIGVMMTILIGYVPAYTLMAQEVNEANLNTLFNTTAHCLSIAATIQQSIERYNCCIAVEQTWSFINTLDLTVFSPELQTYAETLRTQITPFTAVGIGQGVQTCEVPCVIPNLDAFCREQQ